MSDDANRPEKKAPSGLDLSGLNELSLGPNWGSGNLPSSKTPRTHSRERDTRGPRPDRSNRDSSEGRRDRRGDRTRRRAPEGEESFSPRGPRGEGSGGRFNRGGPRTEAPFKPLLEADFYPDDAPFKALTQAIKSSCRTFELFEIARLILEKPERWVCVAKHPEQQEGADALLHACVVDGLPFLSEQAAVEHAIKQYAGQFFTIEEVELEAPSGTFPMIHRCGMTGELLAPPNYHRYQTILREHHASRLAHVPFERFSQKLEAVKEPEAISEWQEKMKKGERFTVKPEHVPAGTEAQVFGTREDARLYLLSHHRDKLVRPAYSVRFLGKDLGLLPEGDPLRKSIEALHEQQLRFPLTTANNLRGRLRRLNFAVYKKGSKGVSFVCAVKRRFRKEGEVLAENLSELLDFIEAHPKVKAPDLPKQYLGLEESAPEKQAAEAGEAAAAPKLSADQEQVLGLRRDLRYLVMQGYVIEYSDGSLYAPPMRDDAGQPLEESKKPTPPPISRTETAPPAAPAAETPVETPTPAPEAEASTAEPEAPVVEAESPAAAEAPAPAESTPVESSESPVEETESEPEAEAEKKLGDPVKDVEPAG